MPEVVTHPRGPLAHEITDGTHAVLADEPIEYGGGGAAMSPYQLLLSALGACTAISLELYAKEHNLPLESVSVKLGHARTHAADALECVRTPVRLDYIERQIAVRGDLTDEQLKMLQQVADVCPVRRTLSDKIQIITHMSRSTRP